MAFVTLDAILRKHTALVVVVGGFCTWLLRYFSATVQNQPIMINKAWKPAIAASGRN